jgi:hypothetical protein
MRLEPRSATLFVQLARVIVSHNSRALFLKIHHGGALAAAPPGTDEEEGL